MTAVVSLAEYKNKETRALFHTLAELADEGGVRGALVVYQLPGGSERMVAVGSYRRRGEASRAGFLLQLEDMNAFHGSRFG